MRVRSGLTPPNGVLGCPESLIWWPARRDLNARPRDWPFSIVYSTTTHGNLTWRTHASWTP